MSGEDIMKNYKYHGYIKGPVTIIPAEEVVAAYRKHTTKNRVRITIITQKRLKEKCISSTCKRYRGYYGTGEDDIVFVRCLGGPNKWCAPHTLSDNPFNWEQGRFPEWDSRRQGK